MGILDQFTEALITEQMTNEGLERGYNGYETYLKKETSWKALLNQMGDGHKAQYSKGSGGELKEKNGRPPKILGYFDSRIIVKDGAGLCYSMDWNGRQRSPAPYGVVQRRGIVLL